MKTLKRICVKSHTISDQGGNSMTVERGKEYITSVEKKGSVTVFDRFWVSFPANLFAGEKVFTKS
jgi:hypothetical protein